MSSDTQSRPGAGRTSDTPLLVESLVIMAFTAFLYGVTYTFDEVPPILAQGVPPTVFPRAILAIIFGLAALQAFKATRLSAEQVVRLKAYMPVPRIVYLTALALIAFAAVLPVIGTFPTLIVFCPGLAYLWGERRGLLIGLSFAGFLAFVYVLFILLLNIPLP